MMGDDVLSRGEDEDNAFRARCRRRRPAANHADALSLSPSSSVVPTDDVMEAWARRSCPPNSHRHGLHALSPSLLGGDGNHGRLDPAQGRGAEGGEGHRHV